MKLIRDGILAFTRDNHIISFDTRDEYDHADIKELNICHIFATPHDMVSKFNEMEDRLENIREDMEDEILSF